MKSHLESLFLYQLQQKNIPDPFYNYKFHSERKFKFDFAWPNYWLACEIEGGTWGKSRHTTGVGFENDCMKYDEAMRLGWNIYRCTGDMVNSGRAIETIEILLFGNEIK